MTYFLFHTPQSAGCWICLVSQAYWTKQVGWTLDFGLDPGLLWVSSVQTCLKELCLLNPGLLIVEDQNSKEAGRNVNRGILKPQFWTGMLSAHIPLLKGSHVAKSKVNKLGMLTPPADLHGKG